MEDYSNSQASHKQEEDQKDFPEGGPRHENQKQSSVTEGEEKEEGEKASTQEREEGKKNTTNDVEEMVAKSNIRRRNRQMAENDKENDDDDLRFANIESEPRITDPVILAQIELIEKTTPKTDLEIALSKALERKQKHIDRLTIEIQKLQQFVTKRKQTYKRKRKDDGAPTRALSAYNIFIQDRFARLAKENEKALTSEDKDAKLKRVPPASLVSSTGNEWKTLSAEVKAQYEERCVGLLMLISRAPYSIF